jgi:hypothetical protein
MPLVISYKFSNNGHPRLKEEYSIIKGKIEITPPIMDEVQKTTKP